MGLWGFGPQDVLGFEASAVGFQVLGVLGVQRWGA